MCAVFWLVLEEAPWGRDRMDRVLAFGFCSRFMIGVLLCGTGVVYGRKDEKI